MHNEMSSLAPANNAVGLMDGPLVKDLLQPPADQLPVATPPATSAGANQQTATSVPPALGRTEPANPQPPSTSAKDLAGPALKSTVTVFANDVGFGVQGAVSAKWTLDPKTTVTAELRERLRYPDGKPGLADHQLSITGERVLVQDKQLKLTGAVGTYVRLNTPLQGGSATTTLGLRGDVVGSYKPESWLELRASAFGQHEWSLPKGIGTTTVGGELRITATEPQTKIAGSLGLRGEFDLTNGGEPLSSAYMRVSAPVGNSVNLGAEVFYGINGNGSSTPSSSWTSQDGALGVVGRVEVNF
jgi:hypothetical protein